MDKSNAEVARELISQSLALDEIEMISGRSLVALNEAIESAQSQLAKKVLADVGAANIIPHPATDYQQGLANPNPRQFIE